MRRTSCVAQCRLSHRALDQTPGWIGPSPTHTAHPVRALGAEPEARGAVKRQRQEPSAPVAQMQRRYNKIDGSGNEGKNKSKRMVLEGRYFFYDNEGIVISFNGNERIFST